MSVVNVVHDLERAASRDAVERLLREHSNIRALLLMADSYFAAMSTGEDVDEALLADAMEYMTEYVDAFHHPKERLAVEAVANRSHRLSTVQRQLDEQLRHIGEAGCWLRSTLEQMLRDEPRSRRELITTGLSYAADMRRNMELQETVVFPVLADLLDAHAWRIIEVRLAPEPDPLFGEKVHQRYAELFRELVSRFGVEGEVRYE